MEKIKAFFQKIADWSKENPGYAGAILAGIGVAVWYLFFRSGSAGESSAQSTGGSYDPYSLSPISQPAAGGSSNSTGSGSDASTTSTTSDFASFISPVAELFNSRIDAQNSQISSLSQGLAAALDSVKTALKPNAVTNPTNVPVVAQVDPVLTTSPNAPNVQFSGSSIWEYGSYSGLPVSYDDVSKTVKIGSASFENTNVPGTTFINGHNVITNLGAFESAVKTANHSNDAAAARSNPSNYYTQTTSPQQFASESAASAAGYRTDYDLNGNKTFVPAVSTNVSNPGRPNASAPVVSSGFGWPGGSTGH